jgi:hypothetical protein
MRIVFPLFLSVGSGRDYRYLVLCFRQFQDTVGVVTFISNQVDAYEPGQQRNRRNHIMNVAPGQKYL